MAKYTDATTWQLPFEPVAELELLAEFGALALVGIEPGAEPRIELSRGTAERMAVHIDKHGQTVRVAFEPNPPFNWNWFGGWDVRATLYVPRDVHAHVQTNAGSVAVNDLDGCELGIKANAGKIELAHVYGVLHLEADAGSVNGQDVGGFLNVETQAGSVRLGVSALQPGEHRIRATMGSVRLELARGLDVSIETHTSMGSVRAEFPSRTGAPAKLLLATEMGSLRIEESRSLRLRAAEATPTAPATPANQAEQADLELERILKMVESGELSAQDADELLRALGRV